MIREGERLDLPVHQMVEGDVVLFQAGDQIYADAKILDGSIMVDEISMTGEQMKSLKLSIRHSCQEVLLFQARQLRSWNK